MLPNNNLKIKYAVYKYILAKIPVIRDRFSPFRNSVFHSEWDLHSSSYGKDLKKVKNGKWLIVGLPKSGNHWLLYLIADCLNLEIIHLTRDINKSGACMTHNYFSLSIVFRKDFIFACYIIRDIRDVIVSYYNYSQTEFYREMDPTCLFNDIQSFYYQYFLSKIVPKYNWTEHPDKYIEHGIPLIKYEDLWDNTKQEVNTLFSRWGINIDNNIIMKAINSNNFDKLSKAGRDFWEKIPTTHYRKGGYGGYKTDLPQKVLDDINYRFGNYLMRWGYDNI